MKVVHVAAISLNDSTGMGRIAVAWKKAFEKSGGEFIHIGTDQVTNFYHPLLFGWFARRYIIRKKLSASIILAHEPIAGFLKFKNTPLVVFSHGVEEREWIVRDLFGYEQKSIKSRLLPDWVRFYSNNYGFLKAHKILLSNNTDRLFLEKKLSGIGKKVFIFTNGIFLYPQTITSSHTNITMLFNGSWIKRKGTDILVKALNDIMMRHINVFVTIAGTGCESNYLKSQFVEPIQSRLTVINNFNGDKEFSIYKDCTIFLFPSYYEGQSLALAQAMYMGLCVVASDNSGQIDVVQHEKNGLLFETGNCSQFVEKIEQVINNPKLAAYLGLNARTKQGKSDWNTVADEVVDIVGKVYQECIIG